MGLEKAKIYVKQQGRLKNPPLEVLFNPADYTVKYQNNYNKFVESKCISQIFVGQKPPALNMTLFLDTYETKESVRDYVNRILELMDAVDDEPTVCTFSWGGFSFDGVLISANQEYTMFLESGIPVRATINAQFVYYEDPATKKKPLKIR